MAKYYTDEEEKLKQLKKEVEKSFMNFNQNYKSFNDFRRWTFVSSITTTDSSINNITRRPNLEFNILEPPISRLRGEVSKQEPAVRVSTKEGKKVDPQLIELVENHFRHIFDNAKKNNLQYNNITDTLSGGFSAVFIYNDYIAEKSFNQDIFIERPFDPTLCGWDVLAKQDNKLDGRYCFQITVMSKEDYERTFDTKIDENEFRVNNEISGFKWSYKSQEELFILVCDFYEKKITKKEIVLCADGVVRTRGEYNKMVKEWDKFEQPPIIVGKPRKTNITEIIRYRFDSNKILAEEETIYSSLPIVFIDGNSILVKDALNSAVRQMTRPLVYAAMGAQRLKNFAGQALANELENIQQSPWMIPKEGIPAIYKEPWTNPQLASCLVYNAFKDDDPNQPLPPPQMVQRRAIPPEITQTFMGADSVIQNILGSFDNSLAKLGERELSGVAIENSLSLSNSAAMPYVVAYLNGMQSYANIILEMLPKIYVTPRTIPIMTKDGKRDYVEINGTNPDGTPQLKFDYDKDALEIKIEAGPSFGAQQAKAFDDIVRAQQVNPGIGQFMAIEGGDVIFDNMDFRGVDILKERYDEWSKMQKQAQQKAQQQPPPEVMKMQIQQMEMQQKAQQAQAENQIKMLQIEVDKQKLELEKAKILASIENQQSNAAVQLEKVTTERIGKAADLLIAKEKSDNEIEMSRREKKEEKASD